MDGNLSGLLIVFLIFLIVGSALFSGIEMAFAAVNRIRIKARSENGDKKAKLILKLLEDYDRTATTVVVANNIVNVLIPGISGVLFATFLNGASAIAASTVTMTILILIFGEIIPKIYSRDKSEVVLYRVVYFLVFFVKVMYPITAFFVFINNRFKQLIYSEDTNEELVEVEDEILTIIEESSQEGKIDEREETLIRNAIEFNEIRVSEILQPKDKIVMVDINEKSEEIFKVIKRERYSRIPVYSEDTDNIIGIMSERDFLIQYGAEKSQEINLRNVLREAVFVPDSLKISKLMIRLQKEQLQMVIVVDERGTVQGLITLEDIIEELVGDIWDEHDDVITDYQKISENRYEVIGDLTLTDFNELFKNRDIKIDTETEETTIAGYVLEKLEKIPDFNEEFEDDYFHYKIIEVTGKKIEKILITVKDERIVKEK